MPASVVKSFADKTGKSVKEVEKLWDKAKALAKEDGRKESDEDFYPYVTGILKKMLKINEEVMNEKIDFKKGAYVILKHTGKVGSIIGISGDKNTADIKFNDGKLKTVEMGDIKLMKESSIKPMHQVGDTLKYYSQKSQKTLMGRVASVEVSGKDIIYGLETGGFVKQSQMKPKTKIFQEFVEETILEELSEKVEVDTDQYFGVNSKKPKGTGQWIFFADKKNQDMNKDDFFMPPKPMTFGEASKLAKQWAQKKNLYRIYVGS